MSGFRVRRSFDAPGTHLCGVTWDGRHLWHSDGTTDLIYRLDATTGAVLDHVECRHVRTELVHDDGLLWQIAGEPKRIVKLDPDTGTVTDTIELGTTAERICGLDADDRHLWLSRKDTGDVQARSKRTGEVARTYNVGEPADGIVVVEGTLWYTSYTNGVLGTFDTTAEQTTARYQLEGSPTGVCWDGELIWYCDYERDQLNAGTIP